ncbi:DNA polymerase III subunit alpha [Enterococcus sp. 10A9_DIV0425]|uniref:DNA polymerase III subunit alpha n=1 Tax=Candidatus Enterococcus wittei TaxID=1987383 RepID=A0A242JVT6_9ENTE|nr:DNA polymerase III subunit alpha [Enterococcus sp. 10A9_DIV0425]OTP09436.1 DNA polymerase III subunit alpha [Enterococcus sp. 10A9_DIV0425]THE09582.1 DNA polymerase III subunit alpha [Enterococcus hirae]
MFLPQLYTTTSYSLLQSTIRVGEYVKTAKKLGYQALAITDRDVLYGAAEFYRACINEQIQPIIGLELEYTYDDRHNQLLFYAKNEQGYQQLMQLSSKKMIQGTLELSEITDIDQLIVILPPNDSIVDVFGQPDLFDQHWVLLQEKVSATDFYVGVTERVANEAGAWLDFLREKDYRLCAVHPIASLHQEELFALATMEHIREGSQIAFDEIKQSIRSSNEGFLIPEAELIQRFEAADLRDAVNHAYHLSTTISFQFQFHQKLLPHYPVPENQPAGTYLRELCQMQLKKRVIDFTPDYQKRLDYELSIIHQMGFDDYFLIVWDVMAFAHEQQIVTGAGRGSAAGSLVAYVLAITDVDPLKYDLLFERFLNPERYTMPDIDLDIPDNRREEVLNYVREKYGQYHMAQIATFGTMAAKMVLRDVARVFGLSQSEANRWSKAIPNQLKVTLKEAYQTSNKLVELVKTSEKNQLLFQTANILEGLPRHVSTHAAGVVLSDKNLLGLVPLQKGSDEAYLTQYTMNDVEAIGLLKMDFLGLRNLSIIDYTLKGIKRVEHQEVELKKIPLNDPKTLRLFQQGETTGVFQFESAGIRNVLRRLSPETIEDIAAVNALYRPGPMQMIDTFISRKKGKEKIHYPDDSLMPILKNTYGVIVYQEQIMQIASKMAGFSLGQADILRRAISKKKKDVIDEEREHFVLGAAKQGYSKEKANEVYEYIERFANYGFNRSHAFAYSFVGFQMAYLKAHHPGAFFASLMNSVRHNTAKLKEYIAEARKYKLKLAPPSINQSYYGFELVDKETIRFGLTAIKGVRRDFIEEIIKERKENGAFQSIDQFLIRINKRWLKLDLLQSLVAAGAFDDLVSNQKQLMLDLEGKIQNIVYSGGSLDLLDIMALKEEEVTDYSLEEKLQLEEEYLGVYLSGHPTEGYERLKLAKKIQLVTEIVPKQMTYLLLMVKEVREIRTKKGALMAFVTGTDSSGEVPITVFPELYRQARALFKENQVIFVQGRTEISKYNQELQLIAEIVADPEKLEEQYPEQTCYLRIKEELDEPQTMKKLQELFQKFPGYIPVVMYHEKDQRKVVLPEAFWVDGNTSLKTQLLHLLQEENVVFK